MQAWRDDYVYVFCNRANPEHWQRLLKVIGREDLSGDERYDTQAARSQRGAEVDEIIAAWTRQHTKEEAMQLFGSAGVPAGAVFDTLELLNDPSFEERAIMQTVDHPTTGKVKVPPGRCASMARRRRSSLRLFPVSTLKACWVPGHQSQGGRHPA